MQTLPKATAKAGSYAHIKALVPQINLLIFFSLFVFQHSFSQANMPVKFGKVSPADFDIKSTLVDSNTNAVIIADYGKSEFIANTTDFTFSLIFTQKKRVKIINSNGIDAATISIPMYVNSKGKEEILESFKAVTYNLENGKVITTKIDKDDLYTEELNNNWRLKKVSLPNVRAGSIIEYSYEINSSFFFEFRSWEFQSQYPTLWSHYQARIPEFFNYVILSQGYQTFFINKTERVSEKFNFTAHVDREVSGFGQVSSGVETHTIDCNSDIHTWVMKDVPGLKKEPFTTTIQNSIAKIEFQLSVIKYPGATSPSFTMNTWEDVCKDFADNDYFGQAISRENNWLYQETAEVPKNATSIKEKASMLFDYVRDNFVFNKSNRITLSAGLKTIFKNKGGTCADINLLLVALLRSHGIDASPVILSTREHGLVNEIYPLMDRYNYLIVQSYIDGVPVYADATQKRIPFGMLPRKIYNGQARVILKEKALPIYFDTDSLTEEESIIVNINNKSGKIEGDYSDEMGFFESLDLRDDVASGSLEEVMKKIKSSFISNTNVQDIRIDSLAKFSYPVSVNCTFKVNDFNSDVVYFTPIVSEALLKNPFISAQRLYPVEMPYTKKYSYTLKMEIPKGYVVDEKPQSVRANFNESDGAFEYIITADEKYVQLHCSLSINKTIFKNDEYESLRDFYGFVVKKQSEQIVFKKVN